MKLENSVVLVNGGASGFGYHLVKELLMQGAKVAVADINTNRGNKMTDETDPMQFIFIE